MRTIHVVGNLSNRAHSRFMPGLKIGKTFIMPLRVRAKFLMTCICLGVIHTGLNPQGHKETSNISYGVRPTAVTSDVAQSMPGSDVQGSEHSEREAYVSLLYGDFTLGLRVLGQSLRESGTNRDYIALCMYGVPNRVKRILRREGWIVRIVKALPEKCLGEKTLSIPTSQS